MSDLPKGFHDWTAEEKSAYWAEQRQQDRRDRQACIDYLQAGQRDAVKEAFGAMQQALNSLHECQDMWLSDVKRLDDCMWKLRREFNLDQDDD